MSGKRTTLSDQLRRIIQEWPESRYRIAKKTGLSESQLSKLLSGTTGVSLKTLDKLGKYFNLELTVRPAKRTDRKN